MTASDPARATVTSVSRNVARRVRAAKGRITALEVRAVVHAFRDEVLAQLEQGNYVVIGRFGTFRMNKRPSRIVASNYGPVPKRVRIPAVMQVRFITSRSVQERMSRKVPAQTPALERVRLDDAAFE